MPGSDVTQNFRLEEYKLLRTKAQDITRRIEELERNVVIACSAIFVFAVGTFKPDNKYQSAILFLLPFCVSVVGFVRYKGLALYMKEVNTYAAGVEVKLAGSEGGWLTYYYFTPRPFTDEHYRQYRVSIWYAIMVFNIVGGAVLAFSVFWPAKQAAAAM